MKRRIQLVIFTVCLGFAAVAAERRPNIVFIMSDDQDQSHFGFTGGDVHTPNLDRMVDNGLWLTDFNVTSTVCSPSRYSFLTGRYAGCAIQAGVERLYIRGARQLKS